MNSIEVNTSSRSYPIYFESDFSGLKDSIVDIGKTYSSYIIITDSNVEPLYANKIINEISSLEGDILVVSFEAGEENKTLNTIESFYERIIKFGADRKALVIALGGGVTGDMAGFCAATYMRGIDFVQVPTSLLSQVDSSVGGKTGVDFNGYKNIVGAFYQPMFVYINVTTLHSLPLRELYAGMSEVVKHGFIKDKKYYDFLKENVAQVLNLDTEILIKMIKWSCEIKKSIVDEDEKEAGVRALLNFGHTFGHSIERLKNFELIHGECVSIGMHGALHLSKELGYLTNEEVLDGIELIKAYNMPLHVTGLDKDLLYKEMFHDKKTTNKKLVFALIHKVGDSFLSTDSIDKKAIYSCFNKIIRNQRRQL